MAMKASHSAGTNKDRQDNVVGTINILRTWKIDIPVLVNMDGHELRPTHNPPHGFKF